MSVDRKKLVVDAVVAPAPSFFVVSVTVNGMPAPTGVGTVSAETTRSGPMMMDRALVLLVVLVSVTAPSPFALAMMKY